MHWRWGQKVTGQILALTAWRGSACRYDCTFLYSCISVVYSVSESAPVTETKCIESGYPRSVTLRCSQEDYLIVIRSAFYARLPRYTSGFCERPTVNGNRGDCVPHADFYGDHVANSCNSNHSCELHISSSRHNIVSACSNVTGQVYFTASFDCVPRKHAACFTLWFIGAILPATGRTCRRRYRIIFGGQNLRFPGVLSTKLMWTYCYQTWHTYRLL